MNEVAERLRKLAADTEDWNGKTMTTWDEIRGQVLRYKGSDLPRLNFESLMENFAEALRDGANEIDRLTEKLKPRHVPRPPFVFREDS